MIHAAYGSSKDIKVYSSLGLKSDQIFTIGTPSRRQLNLPVSWISNGYAEHLAYLTSPGGSRPAQGNARMVIPKGTDNSEKKQLLILPSKSGINVDTGSSEGLKIR